MMKKYRWITQLILAGVLLVSCSEKDVNNFSVSHDILHPLHAIIQEETQIINFQKKAHPERFFLRGWDTPKKNFTQVKTAASSLLFYTYNATNDLEIDIRCQPLSSPQQIKLTLNNTPVTTFAVDADLWKTYQLSLPANSLKIGQNILELQIEKEDGIPAKKLTNFESITFQQNRYLEKQEDATILQRSDSTVSYFSHLPQRFQIDLQYQNFEGARAKIAIRAENSKTIVVKLPKKKTVYRRTITLPQKGEYRVDFITDGATDGYTLWKQIRIHTENPIIHQHAAGTVKAETLTEQGFSKIEKPDIFFYVIDTLRADHVGCYGYERNTTPHIDRFAQENTLFLNAYTNTPWTRPSAASILTGLFPKHHKTKARQDKLPEELVTLAEILEENGYYTVAFLTNPNLYNNFGFDAGFTEFKEYKLAKLRRSDHVTDEVVTFLETYLQQQKRKPLFLLIWTIDPHDPYNPPESVQSLFQIEQYTPIDTAENKFLHRLRNAELQPTSSQLEYIKTRYDQEIYSNDRSFGTLLDHMKRLNIYNDAVVLVTSDHGEEFFERGGFGHGRTLYNEIVKTPFIFKLSQLSPGIHEERAQHIDIYPTILDLLEVSAPYQLDGISLLRKADALRPLYFEEHHADNEINARLGEEEKFIFTKQVNRRPAGNDVPVTEVFALEDTLEQNNLGITGYKDRRAFQDITLYRHLKGMMKLQQVEVEIPAELDQHLKDLGYVQ